MTHFNAFSESRLARPVAVSLLAAIAVVGISSCGSSDENKPRKCYSVSLDGINITGVEEAIKQSLKVDAHVANLDDMDGDSITHRISTIQGELLTQHKKYSELMPGDTSGYCVKGMTVVDPLPEDNLPTVANDK